MKTKVSFPLMLLVFFLRVRAKKNLQAAVKNQTDPDRQALANGQYKTWLGQTYVGSPPAGNKILFAGGNKCRLSRHSTAVDIYDVSVW